MFIMIIVILGAVLLFVFLIKSKKDVLLSDKEFVKVLKLHEDDRRPSLLLALRSCHKLNPETLPYNGTYLTWMVIDGKSELMRTEHILLLLMKFCTSRILLLDDIAKIQPSEITCNIKSLLYRSFHFYPQQLCNHAK